jgi:hypothetical protein
MFEMSPAVGFEHSQFVAPFLADASGEPRRHREAAPEA